jgi:two-component system, NarL family, sensor histidine kinase UhpB
MLGSMESTERSPAPRYPSLFLRVVAVNAVLLVVACVGTLLVVAPERFSFSSIAAKETVLVIVVLIAVAFLNVALLRRVFTPLERMAALARRFDPRQTGQRVPIGPKESEVTDVARAFNEMLERLELERREATRRVLAAHESERLRIARELHDEVGQTLTAVLLQLSRLDGQLPESLSGELSEAQDAARESLEDVRRIATDLRPEALRDLGLASALAALGDGFGRRTGLRVDRKIQTPTPLLSSEAELVVYRVAQEALTNVARHADADGVKLTLTSDGDRLTLTVRDHGRGLRSATAAEGGGIRGMHERAGLIGAELRIGAPSDGAGTELRLELPLGGEPCNA